MARRPPSRPSEFVGTSPDERILAWVCDALGREVRVAATIPLTGGLSEAMFRLELTGADVAAVVLRRWPHDGDWERDSVRREATALGLLAGSGVGAPELIASDPAGESTGRPANLMTHLPGAGELDPADVARWTGDLADRLALVHDQPRDPRQQTSPKWVDLDDGDRRAWLAGLPYGEEALSLAGSVGAPVREVFGHGDYQHFNLLWSRGRLTGVVDWTMSGVADAGRDVGHCALNLAVLYGPSRAWRFLERYEAITGTRVDRGWLISELLEFSPAWPEFIPRQVGGRTPVDGAGMRGRVEELISRVLRSAG
ncbi:aminoglycoside phosphotransferase family protein [Occultella glacieicola]|uniref:Aminoglycoside phosphotransferase family protein n=1 Tax=Occultella glacieicola TaxID=2518684 RepID=A0ABY2E5K1_9MICO|nr:aminoglycoside phosphotransferase family protein [Occultella glacieicola]TDE91498.1 aminoglycoside phosphotransferase family protein [Occultella glacieicola]